MFGFGVTNASHGPSSSYISHLAAKAIHVSLSEAPQLLAQQQLAADVRYDELARGLSVWSQEQEVSRLEAAWWGHTCTAGEPIIH